MATGEDMRPDSSNAYGAADVVEKVEQRLQGLGDIGGADDGTPTPEHEEDLNQVDDTDVPEDDAGGQEGGHDDSEGAQADGGVDAIPDSYLRAATHAGWTPEEVSELYKADPALALKMLEKVHESVNTMTQQFSDLGRARRAAEQDRAQPPKAQDAESRPQVDLVDVAKLRSEFPDSPLVDVVAAMNENMKRVLDNVQPRQEQSQPQKPAPQSGVTESDMAVAQQIATFFASKDMEKYGDFYGPSRDEDGMPLLDAFKYLTPGQMANRRAVFQWADAITAGVEAQGRSMTAAEALSRAHLMVTEPLRAAADRKELKDNVKKRAAGTTLKPSRGASPPAPAGKALTASQVESRARERLNELFKTS